MATVQQELVEHLVAVARCGEVRRVFEGEDVPCSNIVNYQTDRNAFQVPTPWLGRLDESPILFIGANPSIGFQERYPIWPGDDSEEVVDAFQNAFTSGVGWIKDGNKQLLANGDYSKPIRFWSQVKGRARELLEREPIPGADYSITEIVRCRSQQEKGVTLALDTCAGLWLETTLALSTAKVLVLLGKSARVGFEGFAGRLSSVCEERVIAERSRIVASLPHPNARMKRTFAGVMTDRELARLRAFATG